MRPPRLKSTSYFAKWSLLPNSTRGRLKSFTEKKNRIILVQHDIALPQTQVRTALNGLLVQDKNNVTDNKAQLKPLP